MAIYQDLVDFHGFAHRYNSVKLFVASLRVCEPKQFDRLEFASGEEAQVDYGEDALTWDAVARRWKRPRLFVMTLRYSHRSFRRVVWKSGQQEQALLSVVREDLMAPDVLATVQMTVKGVIQAAAAEQGSGANIDRRQAELRAEIRRLVEAVAQLGISEALRQRLAAAESELASLTAAAAPRLKLDPDRAAQQALVAYKRRLLDLGAALQQDTMDRERTRALLADILGPVVLRRDSEGEWAEMEEPAQRLALAGSTLLTMVARARNLRRKLIRARDH